MILNDIKKSYFGKTSCYEQVYNCLAKPHTTTNNPKKMLFSKSRFLVGQYISPKLRGIFQQGGREFSYYLICVEFYLLVNIKKLCRSYERKVLV